MSKKSDKELVTGPYTENDIDEMVELLSSIKSGSDSLNGNVIHHYIDKSKPDLDELSVAELKSAGNGEMSFYDIVLGMGSSLALLSNSSKSSSKLLKRVHHDLVRLNGSLERFGGHVHVSNLLKMYELGLLEDWELSELMQSVNNFLEDDGGES